MYDVNEGRCCCTVKYISGPLQILCVWLFFPFCHFSLAFLFFILNFPSFYTGLCVHLFGLGVVLRLIGQTIRKTNMLTHIYRNSLCTVSHHPSLIWFIIVLSLWQHNKMLNVKALLSHRPCSHLCICAGENIWPLKKWSLLVLQEMYAHLWDCDEMELGCVLKRGENQVTKQRLLQKDRANSPCFNQSNMVNSQVQPFWASVFKKGAVCYIFSKANLM